MHFKKSKNAAESDTWSRRWNNAHLASSPTPSLTNPLPSGAVLVVVAWPVEITLPRGAGVYSPQTSDKDLGTWGADCSRPRPRLAHKDGRPLKPRMGSGSAAFRRLTLQRPGLVRGEGDVLDTSTVRSPTSTGRSRAMSDDHDVYCLPVGQQGGRMSMW